jgi:putative tricarboxylic transport membrane protein
MWILLLFGIIGYLMRKFRYEPGPLVLAYVLGRSSRRPSGSR